LSFSFKNGQSYKLFSICCTSVEVCTVAVRIADNGKSIGEVREKRRTLVQFRPNGADAFSDCKIREKNNMKSSGGCM
jgi:hypothetical protein